MRTVFQYNIRAAPKEIKTKHISNCLKANKAYDIGIAKALGIKLSEVPK